MAFEDGGVGRPVDFIHTPVIRPAQREKTGRGKRHFRLALTNQDAQRVGPAGVVDIRERSAEIDVVCGARFPGCPRTGPRTRTSVAAGVGAALKATWLAIGGPSVVQEAPAIVAWFIFGELSEAVVPWPSLNFQ